MKRILALVLAALMLLSMAACASSTTATPAAADTTASRDYRNHRAQAAPPAWKTACLTVGMECAYAPYNWTQMDDSNGAVPISNVPGAYANGYDVMIAKKICEANGWELEIVSTAWDSLLPGCPVRHDGRQHRRPVHDRRPHGRRSTWPARTTTPPSSALTTKDSPYASAASIADLAGGKCTVAVRHDLV